MRKFILLPLLAAFLLPVIWACSGGDDDEPEPASTSSSPVVTPSTSEPTLVLLNNGDNITVDGIVTITAEGGSEIILSITTNGEDHELEDEPDIIILPEAEEDAESTETSTNIDLPEYFGVALPTGTDLIEIVLTAWTKQPGKQRSAPVELEFTLVATLENSITVALEEDTGDDGDNVTTNANLVLGGMIHEGAELSFQVTTNGEAHSNDVSELGTNDFGLAAPSEPLNVILTVHLERHGHNVMGAMFKYTVFSWPVTSVDVTYTDDGPDDTDGFTTYSELTVVSEFPSWLRHRDVKVVSYVVTNTDTTTATTNDADKALNSDFKVNMRDVRFELGTNEKIHAVTFDYKGHGVEFEFDPALYYPYVGRYARRINTVTHPFGIAMTAEGVLLVVAIKKHQIYFYNPTTGRPTNMNLELTPDDDTDLLTRTNRFGRKGSGYNQFDEPHDIAVGADGTIYVSSYWNDRIRIFDANFAYQERIFKANKPDSIHIHDGYLYVAGFFSWPAYSIRTYAEDDLSRGADMNPKRYLMPGAVDTNGVHHVLNQSDDRVEAWTGSPQTSFTRTGHRYTIRPPSGTYSSKPWDAVIGPTTGRIYVSDVWRHQVLVFEYDSSKSSNHYTLLGFFGRGTSREGRAGNANNMFNQPKHMLIYESQLYIVDGNHRIQVFDIPE